MAIICNITTANDHDYYRLFLYTGSPSGNPISLVGNSMVMKLRHHASDIEAAKILSTDTGEIFIVEDGAFTVRMSQAFLLTMAPGEYVHSLIRTTADGQQLEVWSGKLTHAMGPSR